MSAVSHTKCHLTFQWRSPSGCKWLKLQHGHNLSATKPIEREVFVSSKKVEGHQCKLSRRSASLMQVDTRGHNSERRARKRSVRRSDWVAAAAAGCAAAPADWKRECWMVRCWVEWRWRHPAADSRSSLHSSLRTDAAALLIALPVVIAICSSEPSRQLRLSLSSTVYTVAVICVRRCLATASTRMHSHT